MGKGSITNRVTAVTVTEDGEYVFIWRHNTFDFDYNGIKAIYNYVKSRLS